MRWIVLIVLFAPMYLLAQTTAIPKLTNDSSLDQILDALDARGKNLKDFAANVELTDNSGLTGDSSSQSGKVYFQKKANGDTRIRVEFDKRTEEDKSRPENHQFIFDNGWLTERDYQAKKEIQTQVLKPGEKMNPLKLGDGPFPLPIGQSKEEVRKEFDVTKVAPDKDDPPNAVHVHLVPKPGTKLAKKFKSIDVWVNDDSAMPRRIQTDDTNPDAPNEKVTDLTDTKIDSGLSDKDFDTEGVGSDWTSVQQPLEN